MVEYKVYRFEIAAASLAILHGFSAQTTLSNMRPFCGCYFRSWHKTDMPMQSPDVRFEG
jgi:hypothetical protein